MDFRFLTLAEIFTLHRRSLEEPGGHDGLKDWGLLESALAMPCASFSDQFLHATPFEMAAAYAYHVAENQPFIDGNKRVAITAALTFLKLNGIDLDDPNGLLYDAMIKVRTRRISKMQVAELFRTMEKKKRS